MKILQVCKKFPYPIKDGEAIAITNLARALHQMGCELTLLCMNTAKHYFDPKKVPAGFNYYQRVYPVDINTNLKASDAFWNLFSKDSYHIARFVSTDFEQQLIELLKAEHFDVVQLETLFLAPYVPTIRRHSNALVAMRAHNVEHEIWERITENTALLPKKWYLQYLTKKLKRFEIEQLNAYDLLVPITDRDQRYFQELGSQQPSVVIPIGIDLKEYQTDDRSFQNDLSISFIGSLDWMPNQEGLQWFLETAWKSISKKYPKIKLHIAGRNTPEWVRQLERDNLIVHGEVIDAHEFINQHSIMIVPLLSGSGMRVKILEGMALGKIVLTTSVGLEGISAVHQKEVLIADNAADFVACFDYCFQHPERLPKIGENARQLIAEKYDNKRIARQLEAAYQKLL